MSHLSYFDTVKPTYIESWPDALMRLSFATKLLPLSVADAQTIIRLCAMQMGDTEGPPADELIVTSIVRRLDDAIRIFPRGAFIRLGSRSPKDSYTGHNSQFRALRAVDALAWLSESERVLEDLELALAMGYTPYLAVRDYQAIKPAYEFRCFIRDHAIIGVSQYDYFREYPELNSEAATIRWAIDTFWPQLRDALHIDPVIADVWLKKAVRAGQTQWQVKLVEINPFFEMTDPCLFDWRDVGGWAREPYEIRLVKPQKPIDYEGMLR